MSLIFVTALQAITWVHPERDGNPWDFEGDPTMSTKRTKILPVISASALALLITSEREARSEFLLIYTKNLSMSGRPAGPPAGRGHAFERLISLEP